MAQCYNTIKNILSDFSIEICHDQLLVRSYDQSVTLDYIRNTIVVYHYEDSKRFADNIVKQLQSRGMAAHTVERSSTLRNILGF